MSNLFEKPTIPKNNDRTLILKTIFSFYFSVIVLLTIVLYFISVGIIAVFDLPLIFPPEKNTEEFLQQWQSYSSAWEKGYYFITVTYMHLALGLILGLAGSLAGNFAGDLILGLTLSLALALAYSLTYSLAFIIFFYLTYFHILLPIWDIKFFYLTYFNIGLPIWNIKDKLITLAQKDPKTGLEFVRVLQEYRPLQRQLAMHIAHAATAGNWKLNPLKELKPPPKIEKTPKLTAFQLWFNQIDKLNEQLTACDEEANIGLKKNQFETLYQELKKFRYLTLNQSSRWNHYYIPAIDQWLKVAKEKLNQLTEDVKQLEPITSNIYRYGEILKPNKDKDIFFGRQDIKSELSRIIITSRTMPMFLFYGQRRVGKSSLVKFLPILLGSRFKVIYQDFQDAKLNNLQNWLKYLRQQLDPKTTNWQVPDNWLTAWQQMETYLKQLTTEHEEKIILAFDEYEALHKNILQTQPEQGRQLLEAMRSFSQQQNKIVFLFVGSTQFVDLKEPNWDRCFIHARPLKIDYLKYEDTKQLITKPVQLDYPDTVIDYIFKVTQGYPALVQMLCSHLVDTANNNKRKNITQEDVEQIIKQHIIQRGTNALGTFWTEFCEYHQCKPAIHELLDNKTISDKKAQIKLEDYGYIIEEANGWKLRVPLLEQWLRRYKDVL